jgi:hypothetical protein
MRPSATSTGGLPHNLEGNNYMPPITNIAGVVCILFLMFFFPIAHGIARVICWLAMGSSKGGR